MSTYLKRLSKNGEKGQAIKRPKDRRSTDMLLASPQIIQSMQIDSMVVRSSPKAGGVREMPHEEEQERRRRERQRNSGVNGNVRIPSESTARAVANGSENGPRMVKAEPSSSEQQPESPSQALVRLESSAKMNDALKGDAVSNLGDIDALLSDITNLKSVLSNCTTTLTLTKEVRDDYQNLKAAFDVQSAQIDQYKRRMERYEKLKVEYMSQGDELQQYKMHLGSLYGENKVLKEKEETWEQDKRRIHQEHEVEISNLRSAQEKELSELTNKMGAVRAERGEIVDRCNNELARVQRAHEEELARVKKDGREDRHRTVGLFNHQIESLQKDAANDKAKAVEELKQKFAQEKQKQVNEHHTERGKLVLEYTKEIDSVRKEGALDKKKALEALMELFAKEKADLVRQINIARSVHQEKPPDWRK